MKYYAHDDKNIDSYDSLRSSFNGISSSNEAIFDEINAYKYSQEFLNAVKGKSTANITVKLVRNEGDNTTTIISSTKSIEVNVNAMVFEEKLTDGGPNKQFYEFKDVPNSFIQGMGTDEILKLYGGKTKTYTGLSDKTFYNGIFTRNFIYIGKRDATDLYVDDKGTKIKEGVFDEGFVGSYNSSTDKIYSLDDKNSAGYKAVAEMLKGHYQDNQIDGLLKKAFFIRNSAESTSVTSSIFVHPQITDPYFLCVFVGDKMKLYSLFEREGSSTGTREVEFSYEIIPTGDKYDMEFSYIRGTTALEGEGTQENPYVFIKPDPNGAIGASDLFPAGTQWFNQIRFKGDSGSHQLFSYEDYSNYYLELGAGTGTEGPDIRKLTIYFRPGNVVYCAKYECYIELIDAHKAEKIVTNNVSETKEYDAYYYDKEGLGLGNQDFYGKITTTGAGFNFVYMNGYYGGDTVYQTEFEIKFGGTTKKFYVIRGDIMPDGRKLSEYLAKNSSFNGKYTFADKISMPTVTGWNDTDWLDINKYACKEYFYWFTIGSGETITYYPYMVSDIDAFYKSKHGGDAYNGKIYTNRAQCLVFSEDGTFVKVFDTGVRVTKNNSNKYDYKTVVPENGEFYIPATAIGWQAGDSGTITAKTTRFYFVSTNDSDPHFFQYAATGKTSTQYPNYRVIDKVTGTKDFHVVSSKGLEYNLYSARIGLLDCGSYLNQGFDGQYPELTIQKDVIVQPQGTDPNGKNWSAQSDDNPNYNLPEYVHLIMANGISGRSVYLNANGSKNTYWLEMYAGNTDTPLEAGHKFSEYFGTGTGKAQTLIVNVYNYGMMITYTFRVKIVEESESLYISRMNYAVLNKDNSGFRTYYVNTSNSESNDILICNERTQYISRNGYPVSIDLYGGTAAVPTDSPVIYVGSGDFSSEEEAINSVKNGGSGWDVFDRRISYVRLWITLTKQDNTTEKIDKKYVYITYAEISEGLEKYNKNHKDSILKEYNSKNGNIYKKAEITGWSTQKYVLGSYSENNDGSINYTKEADPFRMTSGETKYLVLKVTLHREVEYMAIKLVGKAANDQTTNDEFVWTINEKWPEGKTTETFGAESNVTCYEFKFAPGEKLFDAGRSCQIMNLYTNVRDSFNSKSSNVQVWNGTAWVNYDATSWSVEDDGTYIKIVTKIVTGSGSKEQTFYAHITTEEAELNTSFAAVNNFNLEKQPLKAGAGGGYNIPTYTMTQGEPLQVGFGASRIYVQNGSQYTTGYVYARYGQSGKSGSYRLYIKYGSVEDNDINSLLSGRFGNTLPAGWTELVIPYQGEGSKNNDDREKTKFALSWGDETQATVVYCYIGYGKEWRAAVNLKLDSENATPTVQAGIRRINSVPYYTDLEGEPPVVIIDGTDAKIKLSTSTIWYSYNGFIKSTSTFSATATKFYYKTNSTKTEIPSEGGILDLSAILGQNGVTIIAEHTISNITYTCEFIVKAKDVKAKITKINNKPVTEDSATVKVYKGERLFPNETITYNSTSIFVYGEKSATTYFYTNTNFKYYYSVPAGTQPTPIYGTDEDGNTTQTIIGYTCKIGEKTYDVIKEGKNYFYLVDMSNFVFNENGTLIVVYLDIYKTSVNIEVVETPEPVIIINNRLYLVPYQCVTDTDGNSSYEKLSANYPDMDKIGAATKTEPFEFGINQYWQSLDKETLQLNFLLKDKLTLMDNSTSLRITLADGSVKNIGIRSWSAKITYNGTEYEYAKEEDNLCKGLGKHKLTLSYTENGYTYVFEFWYTFKQN